MEVASVLPWVWDENERTVVVGKRKRDNFLPDSQVLWIVSSEIESLNFMFN